MRELPIIFCADLIPAVMDGKKTMTRRIMKFKNPDEDCFFCGEGYVFFAEYDHRQPCFCRWIKPRYQKGDHLWVRETFKDFKIDNILCGTTKTKKWQKILYKADLIDNDGYVWGNYTADELKWKSPYHMFKKHARTWLEVVEEPRTERLQDISIKDEIKEGCPEEERSALRNWFRNTWDSIHKKNKYKYSENPWVFVYEFRRIEK